MPDSVYTALTFAPVQGFIEKSRKLRDLYGSSFLLSYLARRLCDVAERSSCTVISPALINVTQGTPNQIIIHGDFPEALARSTFEQAWADIVEACREEIERRLPDFRYCWNRAWNACSNHTWEFFWAQTNPKNHDKPDRIGDVRRRLNEQKRSRDWTGINWTGESSTLSGADAIAWHGMADKFDSKRDSIAQLQRQQKDFYEKLSQEFSESIVAPNERLSIAELIKRLITLPTIADRFNLESDQRLKIEVPMSFPDIHRHSKTPEEKRWTGWFQGDGDRIGEFLRKKSEGGQEGDALHQFSKAMMDWGAELKTYLPNSEERDGYRFVDSNRRVQDKDGRIIYAGGDDFLGVLYRNHPQPELTAQDCLDWFYQFPEIWKTHKQDITVSIGWVWAAPGVPQRDVLQHCREAEQSAKSSGRDRLAIRILFNSGNTLEWTCPWEYLPVLKDYRDRNDKTGKDANWTHFFQDVAALESRHAFKGNTSVALALFKVYFGKSELLSLEDESIYWNTSERSGVLGDGNHFSDAEKQDALNEWVINLAKVGFHLHRGNSAADRQAA
jgi:CRISPR-associated protein Cmr2